MEELLNDFVGGIITDFPNRAKTIIDEHVFIGNNVKLINEKNLKEFDGNGVYVRDGITIVTAGTKLPSNFVF